MNNHPNEFIYKNRFYSKYNELYEETVRKSKLGIYSDETIVWMYSATARNELDLISKEQPEENNKIVIQDSFFLNRMIGVHGITNRKILIAAINDLIKQFNLPEQTFYIYADLQTRKKDLYREKILKSLLWVIN